MRGKWTRVIGAIAAVWLTGCQTLGASGPGMSASDSGSGNSADSSQSDSGSSDSGSGNSSQSNSGSQESGSGSSQSESSESGSSQSDTSGSKSGSSDSSNNSVQSSEASAQSSKESSKSSGSSRSSQGSYSPVLSATLGAATAVGLGFAIWQLAKTPAIAIPPPEAVGAAAQTYLRGRTHQLRQDLALGAGPSIEDLATLARIRRENLRRFGQLLREHRAELLSLAQTSTLTPERALAWLDRVGRIASTDPRLREDRRAFALAHGLME